MLPITKMNKYIYIVALFIVLILSGAYFFGYFSAAKGIPGTPKTEAVQQDSKIKVTKDTILKQKLIYTRCDDVETYSTKAPDNLIGVNFMQMQKMYPGWTIEKFDINEIEMSLKVNSLCREHANNMFIGIKDGFVAVFYGKPGGKIIVKEVTQIPVANLMPNDQEELKRGLIVSSREEMFKTLEGLQSR